MKNTIDMDLARSIDPDAWRKIHKDDEKWCQTFADLVRADERNAICDIVDYELDSNGHAEAIKNAIRARGKA
jgi:hypothetical protein